MKYSILDNEQLEIFRKQHGLQPFRLKQIIHEVFANSNINFEDMTTLSKELRTELDETFETIPFKVHNIIDNDDTTKIAFETKDGHIVESVIMYHTHEKEDWDIKLNRITLCISSQVWCPVGCIFCVTWKLWMSRNLDYTEIIWQLLFANNFIKNKCGKKEDWSLNKVRNIVFMWMWEPFLNYENMKKSIQIMLEQNKFSLSRRHITISTSWVIPWIEKMLDDQIDVMLAISLHAPNQDLRNKLIPTISPKYDLPSLMNAINTYIDSTWNRIFYEYIMIKWLTDTPELAQQLSKLLKWQLCHINLIPYNENPAIDIHESATSDIQKFKEILEKNGLTVTIRASMWRDKKWACWQLGYEKVKNKI